MEDDQFYFNLKLNVFELFKPSAARKNLRKLNIIDVEAKIRPLYLIASRKPTDDEIIEAIESLENNGYLTKVWLDDIEYWSMNEQGEEALKALYDGEDIQL